MVMFLRLMTAWSAMAALHGARANPARYLPDLAPVTHAAAPKSTNGFIEARQLEPSSSSGPEEAAPTVASIDPWQCVTEDVAQFFTKAPIPDGSLLDSIGEYGGQLIQPCIEAAGGDPKKELDCSVSDMESWCGFTTFAPPEILVGYSTFLSSCVKFWTEKSESIKKVSTSCPVTWNWFNRQDHFFLTVAMGHAQCYLEANGLATPTAIVTPTSSSNQNSASSTSTLGEAASGSDDPASEATLKLGPTPEVLAIITTGLLVLAGAV